MLDFAPDPAKTLIDRINKLIDDALVTHTKAEYEATRGSGVGDVAKKRIGAGYIGLECGRQLAFRYHKWPKEEVASVISAGELQRHAEAGHWTETVTAEWMRLAGFDVRTHKVNSDGSPPLDQHGKPKQFGFMNAPDENGQNRLAGEVDGMILAVPKGIGLPNPPIIWESKKATHKKWTEFSNKGVKGADPKYYGQLQTTMGYMGIEHALFSMLNLDNMKYYWELVRFDHETAQRLTDRAVMVLTSQTPFELPRVTRDESDYRCKFCEFKKACWEQRH